MLGNTAGQQGAIFGLEHAAAGTAVAAEQRDVRLCVCRICSGQPPGCHPMAGVTAVLGLGFLLLGYQNSAA